MLCLQFWGLTCTMYLQSSCPVPPGRSRVSATAHLYRIQSVERLSSAGIPGLLYHSHRTPVSQPHCEEELSRTASMPLCTDLGCIGRHCIPGQMAPFGCYRIYPQDKPLLLQDRIGWCGVLDWGNESVQWGKHSMYAVMSFQKALVHNVQTKDIPCSLWSLACHSASSCLFFGAGKQ